MQCNGIVVKSSNNRLTVKTHSGILHQTEGDLKVYTRVEFRISRHGVVYNLKPIERKFHAKPSKQ